MILIEEIYKISSNVGAFLDVGMTVHTKFTVWTLFVHKFAIYLFL